jgi:hypothetical protein
MPYPNEYTARINPPDKYKSIKRENDKFGLGIDVIWGILPDGKTEIQAIRFKSNKFTSSEEVQKWLSNHNFKSIEFSSPSKKGDSFYRFDSSSMVSMTKTPEGFLKGTARVTRTGVFSYRNADGTTHKELRLPEEVFNKNSIETMKMIPIANEHPADKLITVETAKDLLIGFTGENITQDSIYVVCPMNIISKEGVKAVESGKKELSLGYEVELDDLPGVYNGDSYDFIQRNIRYNHLVITARGRAGSDVRLNIDNFDAYEINEINSNNEENNKPNNTLMKGKDMVKVIIDGIEYEVSQETSKLLASLEKKNKEMIDAQKKLEQDNTTLQAKLDSANEQIKTVQEKLDDKDSFRKAVKARILLEKTAESILDDEIKNKFDSMPDIEIKKVVILKSSPDAKLDDASIDYINARFDSTIEFFSKSEIDTQRKTVNDSKSESKNTLNSDDSRKKMIEEMKKAHKC